MFAYLVRIILDFIRDQTILLSLLLLPNIGFLIKNNNSLNRVKMRRRGLII